MPNPALLTLGRCAIAGVWLFQGLWCKVLGKTPRQAEIVAAAPPFNHASAPTVVAALGWLEVFLAVWVLSGRSPVAAAITQTVLLISMNVGGIVWARKAIPDAGSMLFLNFAFVILIWICS